MDLLLASAFSALVLAQAPVQPSALEPPPAVAEPAASIGSPTDDFGPPLKAWLDADKLQDPESAARALADLQRLRAERNLTSVPEVAAAISGRAEVRASEGTDAGVSEGVAAALSFAPDSAYETARGGDAWSALSLAWDNPLEHGRVLSTLLLGFLVVGGLFAAGFSLAILLRYAAVFSHDVAEGLPESLKSLALFMAVLFLALPLAGLLGWGYLPFWWLTLFFIFQSRPEKAVTLVILVALALSSLAIPTITHQRSVAAAPTARPLYLLANGGISAEGEALVHARLSEDPTDLEWSLLSASLSRRAGRFDEAAAALAGRAGTEPRFAHNTAALELMKGNFAAAAQGFRQASEASLSSRDRATALYNLSLAQVNTLAFDESKESRRKGDALDAPALARFDRLFSFDRDGSTLQAPPDIVPDPALIVGSSLPVLRFTADNAGSRLMVIAVVLLLFIPGIVKFRGSRSFSKQCPKCGTAFCWLCQTRSTSQDVCSQCHHLFVVKRGIPPAARTAKAQEIARYNTIRGLTHRLSSLAAPGAGHLSVGHFSLGFPLMLVWAVAVGSGLVVHFLAPQLLAGASLGSTLRTGCGVLAGLCYILAQAVPARPPVVATVQRRRPGGEEEV